MPRGDVGDFVRHHASNLGFAFGGQQQPAVDVKKPARQRKSIYILRLYDFYGERYLCVRIEGDILTDAIYIFGDYGVGDQFGLSVNLCGELPSEIGLLFQRVKIDAAFVNIPLADHQGIFLVLERLLFIFLISAKRSSRTGQHHKSDRQGNDSL